MIIAVEQRHINKGQPESSCGCPIALAIKEQTTFTDVRVYDEVEVDDSYIALSRSAHRFIAAFDSGRKVKPFRFRLGEVVSAY